MRRLDSKEYGSERLEAELEAARDGLRCLDKDIRKILGRDLPEGENAPTQLSSRIVSKRPLQEDRKRNTDHLSNDQGGKRRWQGPNNEPKTVFSRLSARVPSNPDDSGDDDDGSVRPAVSSRVIATPREVPSRQDVIRRENVDERSRQRNKRMFGALLGTLQKFRQEETKLKAKEDKKAEVEARVEEAKRREKEELRRERQQLFLSRKRQLAEVKALEAKLARSKQFQEWRSSQLPLANFIRTRAQPPIYYLPKRKHPRTDALLEECAKEFHEEVERREKVVMEELEIIEFQVNNNKPQHQVDDLPNQPQITETSQPMEEGVENCDPNPEHLAEESADVEISTIISPITGVTEKQSIEYVNEEMVTDIEVPEEDLVKNENHG
ncbi:pinin [Diachasmimorpha longicaudata]|uniref:pinin n=1 Tax=Diachasmimorpha longicaudata TaxID=58733 RepID=UPI0030B8838E